MRPFFLILCLAALAMVPLACNGGGSTGPSTGGGGSTPSPTVVVTPAMTAVVNYGGSDNFSPSSVTILVGGSVSWSNTFGSPGTHDLYVDDGAHSASCAQGPFDYPKTITFPSAGTYQFHCHYHTTCATSCSGCSSGMVGTVRVE